MSFWNRKSANCRPFRTPARAADSNLTTADAMENQDKPDRSNVHYIKRLKPKRLVSRTRLVMGLLLIVAIPIFISLADKAVHENADAIRQVLGR
jgi:hypothetical protein